jgi:hypothetical protein
MNNFLLVNIQKHEEIVMEAQSYVIHTDYPCKKW